MNQEDVIVELQDNKLIISDSTMNYLSINPGDRLSVNYVQNKEGIYPVIGKSEMFSDPESGSKVTKSKTLSFRGLQNKILSRYGHLFTLEKDSIVAGVYKMTPVNGK